MHYKAFLAILFVIATTKACVATTFVILLDRSRSSEAYLGPCKELLPPFLRKTVQGGDQVDVVIFDNRVEVYAFAISTQTKEQDLDKITAQIKDVQSIPNETGTNLKYAWNYSSQLASSATSSPVIVLCVSDGISQGEKEGESYAPIPTSCAVYLIGYSDPARELVNALYACHVAPATLTATSLPLVLDQELAPRLIPAVVPKPQKVETPPATKPIEHKEPTMLERMQAFCVSIGISIAQFVGFLVIGVTATLYIASRIYNKLVEPDSQDQENES